MNNQEIKKYKEAGNIALNTKEYALSIIKKDMLLLEIAEKIENFIREQKAKPAFPVNLSIDEIAAHATPSFDSIETAKGLLKVDIGVQIEGFVADTALSIDLENSIENKKLIEAAEEALKNASKIMNLNISLREIGKTIEKTIKDKGLQPIINLSGHSIEQFDLHAGITIPNFDNHQDKKIEEGVYAIEPFTTNGLGQVREGKNSGIFVLEQEMNVRDSFAREVLEYIIKEYNTLPFCSRWLYKKFGSRSIIALKRLEDAKVLHQYAILVESSNGKVAQAESTFILTNKEKIITTN